MKLDKAIQRCFDTANLIGESVDLDGCMMKYKAIRDLYYDSPAEYELIYQDLSARLFGR